MNIEEISQDLVLSDEGIWQSKKRRSISYPDQGNETCFAVEEVSFWFHHRNNCIKTLVSNSLILKDKQVFDIGGGNGYVAKGIQDLGVPVVLVEPGIHGARNALERGLETVVCSTLEDANFSKSSLPAVGIFDVLEHIEDDLGFLKKLNGLTQVGGKLFITVPAYQWLWSKEDDDAGHFRRYTKKSLIDLVGKSGYKVEFASYFFALLPLPILLFRTIPSLISGSQRDTDKKIASDHKPRLGLFNWLLNMFLDVELKILKKQKSILFGGSIILVAGK